MNKSFLGILFLGIGSILSSCCGHYVYYDDGPVYYNISEKHLQYDNPNEHFTKVSYSNCNLIETPNSNTTLWNISAVNPQTTIYLESNFKKDTLTYTLTVSKIYYNDGGCGNDSHYQTDFKGPNIIYSTFDSIIKSTQTVQTGTTIDQQEIYRLK